MADIDDDQSLSDESLIEEEEEDDNNDEDNKMETDNEVNFLSNLHETDHCVVPPQWALFTLCFATMVPYQIFGATKWPNATIYRITIITKYTPD